MAHAVSKLIQHNDQTRRLVSKAWSLSKLQDTITEALPLELRALGSIQLGDLQRGELTLLVTSPAFATRLRFASATILKAIADDGRLKVSHIKVRVAPLPVQARKPRRTSHRTLSNAAKDTLLKAAQACSDPKLAAVFRRLAERHRSD